MWNPLKEFLYFSRTERRGLLCLTVLILLVFLCGEVYLFCRKRGETDKETSAKQAEALAEYEHFIASVREKEQEREEAFKQPYQHYDQQHRQAIVPVPFDPNTADSITLCGLGLPGWMARNILRYRERGGKFRKAEDFKKIYGLTSEQYNALASYIRIAPEDTVRPHREMSGLLFVRNDAIAMGRDSITDTREASEGEVKKEFFKYPQGTVIDLNRADTTELKKIPGIGCTIARMIANYRSQLGGFYRIEQLAEIQLDYEQLRPWFNINPQDIQRININRYGVERLRRHPYINFYQAKAIVEYRKKNGALKNLKPFILLEEFTEEDLERITWYVCFE